MHTNAHLSLAFVRPDTLYCILLCSTVYSCALLYTPVLYCILLYSTVLQLPTGLNSLASSSCCLPLPRRTRTRQARRCRRAAVYAAVGAAVDAAVGAAA